MKKKALFILMIIICIGIAGAAAFVHFSKGNTSPATNPALTEAPTDNANAGTASNPSVKCTPIPTETPPAPTEAPSWWLTIDTTDLEYDAEENTYYIDEKLNLSCELNPAKEVSFLSCNVTNELGDTVFYCEPVPDNTVLIENIGLFWGYNEVKFVCKNKEEEYNVSYTLYNSSSENAAACSLDYNDNDGDSLYNYLEAYMGTNKDLADTDQDGLDDYLELFVLYTDPLNADSNENGTSDFKEDSDLDGIPDINEIQRYQTDPFSPDTDGDGLNDMEELSSYLTNPLLADTDGDGFSDGNEVLNSYDPLTANASFAITQADTDGGITAAASIHVSGTVAESFSVQASEDVRFNESIPGYLSDAFSFDVNNANPGTVTLSFTLNDAWLQNKDIAPAICCFDEETQCFYALDTSISGGVATAQTTHFSTYMLLDQNTMYRPQMGDILYTVENEKELPSADTDSNNDGISDLDTYLLCHGLTLTGMGQKVFGDATYEEVQANNDFDGDGLLNGEEITLQYMDTVPGDAAEFNGHFYKTFDIGEYWDTARFKAENMGGYLCTVTSPEEQEFVKNLLPDNGMGLYWMGSCLTDAGWTWVTGEPFAYTHWGDSEPNNMQAVEAYMEMYAKPFKKKVKGDWNDASNEGAQYSDNFYVIENTGYIVEWNDMEQDVKYALLHSNPTKADTDGDGIGDAEDTAIYVRGLKDGVLAKLTILTSNNGKLTKGHAFLLLHSYVDDLTLDVSEFYRGVDIFSSTDYRENLSPTTYTLASGTDIALGSAGNDSMDHIYFETIEESDAASFGIWLKGGLWYNLEPYKYYIGYAKYGSNCCLDYELTQHDLHVLEDAFASVDFIHNYHGLFDNCTTVAEEVWNKVVPSHREVDSSIYYYLTDLTAFSYMYDENMAEPLLVSIKAPIALKKYMQDNFTDYYDCDMAQFNWALAK